MLGIEEAGGHSPIHALEEAGGWHHLGTSLVLAIVIKLHSKFTLRFSSSPEMINALYYN